ncbi:tetratricopeptide repeat protein [Nocardia salmonicida]|uniref:tetratricopeptide repeat protein n=1 Tax=Nocardia salmonicida TaxID=53431 RepID=UPI0033CCC35C
MSDQLHKAEILIDLRREAAARDLLGPLLAAEPDNGTAWALLAYAWAREGEAVPAAEAARTALRIEPVNLFAWKVTVLAENQLGAAAANREIAAAHSDRALWAADRCVDLDPMSAECHRLRATVLRYRDRRAALAVLDHALTLDPENVDLHLMRGEVLWDDASAASRPTESARAAFAHALRIDPGSAEALYLLGFDAVHNSRWAEARRLLRRAAELNPTYGPQVRELLSRESAWRAEYLGKPGRGRVSAGWAIAAVIVVSVMLSAVFGEEPDPAAPSRRTPAPTQPSYYRPPPSYFQQLPLPTPPRFPSDRWPTGKPWPTPPRQYLTPAPLPPPQGG